MIYILLDYFLIMILKKIGVLSLAKVYSALMTLMGLIFGLFFTLINFSLPTLSEVPGPYNLIGVWAIIFLPIFYGILGFVAGGTTAWIYNLVAKYIGGLELDFDKN